MGDNGSRSHNKGGGGNKPPPPGISPSEHHQLRARVEKLERTLQEHYAEKNQWNSLVREWVGSAIVVWLGADHNLEGKLLWVDRYTLCLEATPPGGDGPKSIIVHKGLVAFLHQR